MRHIHYYIIGLALVLGMASCSSSRKVADGTSSDAMGSVWSTGESVVARASISLSSGKGKEVKLGGTLRMKRNDVVQLNASYLLGIQIGTLEITKDSVLIVSRTTRQFAHFDYMQLSHLMGETIDFQTLQGVFWGENNRALNGVKCKYGSFAKMDDGRRLPQKIELTFSGGDNAVKVSLDASNHRFEDGWRARTQVNKSNYTLLTPDQVVRIISLLIDNKE